MPLDWAPAACYGRAIALLRPIGTRASLVLALAALAASAGSAWCAATSSVAISGPRQVSAGHSLVLQVSGYAGPGGWTLVVRVDNRQCASTERAEAGRPHLARPVRFRVDERFLARVTVKRSVPGTHFACAYVVSRLADRTRARATWRYVTRR